MAPRLGMLELITEVRTLTDSGTADFTLAGQTYFSDQYMQDALDKRAQWHIFRPLEPVYVYEGGVWRVFSYTFPDGVRWLEREASGAAFFKIQDSAGNVLSPSTYTVDYFEPRLTFLADTGGSARYWTGRSYRVFRVAADLWRIKASFYARDYTFKTGFDHFMRKQKYENALNMMVQFEGLEQLSVPVQRIDLL